MYGLGHGSDFGRQSGRKFGNPGKKIDNIGHQGFGFSILGFGFRNNFNLGLKVGFAVHEFKYFEAAESLNQQLGAIILGFGHF